MATGKEQPAASYDSVNVAIERPRLLRNSEHLWRPGHRHPRVTAYRSASRIGWLEGNVPCAQTLMSLQAPLVPRLLTGKLHGDWASRHARIEYIAAGIGGFTGGAIQLSPGIHTAVMAKWKAD